MTRNLTGRLAQLRKMKRPAERGRAFEQLVFEVFAESGFRVRRDPDIAIPRQTDLVAVRKGQMYLVEVKWQRDAIDISHIDELCSRLDRTPPDVVGVLVAMSSFSDTALQQVRSRHDREILLIDELELEVVAADPDELPRIIEQKRRVLREDRRVWFYGGDEPGMPLLGVPLPPAEELVVGMESPAWRCRVRDFHYVLFSRTPPGFMEAGTGDLIVGLRLSLKPGKATDLERTLEVLQQHGGLAGNGSFAINQTSHSWHGIGVDNFLLAVMSREERYRGLSAGTKVHHTEDVAYFENTGRRRLLLETRQRAWQEREGLLGGSSLEIHLPGVPADLEPYERVCMELRDRHAMFTPTVERLTRAEMSVPLKCLANINSRPRSDDPDGDTSRIGIVAHNPFYKKKRARGIDVAKVARSLSDAEHLVCDLQDWIGPDDEVDQYRLIRVESVEMGNYCILHPVCTWGKVTSERCPPVDLKEACRRALESMADRSTTRKAAHRRK